MGDFNIDLLQSETCDFSHNFVLSMQSYSFFNNFIGLSFNLFK